MALLKKLELADAGRPKVHQAIDATYFVFEQDGVKYLQIDTRGLPTRKEPNKTSQAIQLGPESIVQLRRILDQL